MTLARLAIGTGWSLPLPPRARPCSSVSAAWPSCGHWMRMSDSDPGPDRACAGSRCGPARRTRPRGPGRAGQRRARWRKGKPRLAGGVRTRHDARRRAVSGRSAASLCSPYDAAARVSGRPCRALTGRRRGWECECWSPTTSASSPTPSPRGCAGCPWPWTSATTVMLRSSASATHRYDVAVLDRDMPGRTGDEVCRWISESDADSPGTDADRSERDPRPGRRPRARRRRLPDQAVRVRRTGRPRPGAGPPLDGRGEAGARARPA